MKWIEVQVKTTSEAVEIVSNILYEAGVGGLAIEDPNDIEEICKSRKDTDWNYIDEDLFKRDFEGILVKAYFPEDEYLMDKIKLIKQNIELIPQYDIDGGLGEVTISEVYESEWKDIWKQYYKPKRIGKQIVIKPSWEEYEEKQGDIILELDPGMAFGTGTHETTMMCIEAIEKYMTKGETVFDIGCGSGILSIAAAKLGAEKVIGVDLDESTIPVSNENVRMNNVEDIVEIRHGDLLEVVSEKADLVVVNIVAEIIKIIVPDVKTSLKQGGMFIASGIILDKIDFTKQALDENGFEIVELVVNGEWACIVSKVKEGSIDA